MADVRGRGPLRMDLRNGKEARPVRWVPRVRWPVLVLLGVALLAVRLGLERLSPGAGVVFDLGLRWVVAAGWVIGLALIWRVRDAAEMPLRWLLLGTLVAAWFLGRAAYETYAVVT